MSKSNPQLLPTFIDEMFQFLGNSKCAANIEEKKYLLKLLGNKEIVTILLYRGSDHGWTAKDFHLRCDHKGPIICLYKIKKGDCIGGFTNSQWSSTTKHVGDCDAILFNLSCSRHYPSKNMGTRYDAVVKLDLLLVTMSLVYILNHLMARETAHHSLIEIVMISQLKKVRTCLLTRRMETSQ